jgi:hypothetical protein
VAAVGAVLAVVAMGAVLSVNLLFKIEKYDLQGESPYGLERLVAAFGHAPGDNMYGFSVAAAAGRITSELPYVESVTIRRRLPSTIVFRVSAAEEGYYLEWADGYVVLSTRIKVLKTTGEAPEGLVRIDGLKDLAVVPGQPLALAGEAAASGVSGSEAPADSATPASGGSGPAGEEASGGGEEASGGGEGASGGGEGASGGGEGASEGGEAPVEAAPPAEATPDERLAALDVMLRALEASGLKDVTWLKVGDPLNLRFRWQDRVTVKLGPRSGMEEKMAATVVLLTDGEQNLIDPMDSGTLDMSYYLSTGRSYFAPD